MKRYKNLSRDAGVRAYDSSPKEIDVRFRDGSIYAYNEKDIGKKELEKMKRLASRGKGLSTLIARDPNVREHYSKRIRGAK